MLAMAMCAVALVSCNKDDDSSPEEESNVYLTLEQQQTLFNQAISEFAEAVDFSGIQPAYDFFMSLHEGRYRVLTENIIMPLMMDSAFRTNITEFVEQLDNDTIAMADFSKLYFKVEFSSSDSVIDETACIVPQLDRLTPNNGFAQFIFKVHGHTIEFDVTAAEQSTTIEINEDISDTEGRPLVSDQTLYVFPQKAVVSVLFDNATLVSFSLDLDTDMKISDAVTSDGDDETHDRSISMTKFNLAANGQVADMNFNATANYDGEKGINAALKSTMDNMELVNATFRLDASMTELLADLSSESLSGWALNYEKLRSIGGRISLMGSDVTFEGQIRNPLEDSKTTTLMAELMSADTITEALSMKLIETLSPFITADCYFKGYRNPQASLVFQYSDSLHYTEVMQDIARKLLEMESESTLHSIALTFVTMGTLAAAVVDQLGISPATAIYNPALIVSVEEYISGIDFVSGAMIVYQKFSDSFSKLIEIIRTAMGTDEE